MTETPESVAVRSLKIIDDFFDEIFHLLENWAPNVQADIASQLNTESKNNKKMSSGQLADLVEEGSVRILKESLVPVYGAGFCASEKVIEHGNPLAWWQGANHEPLASSTFGVGPGAVDLRRLEWYRVPETTRQRNVAGPFVDYLCSNEVTITSSLPILIDGDFAGVLCLDVLVIELEDALAKKLSSNFKTTVINSNRRVVLSTDHTIQTGDKFVGDNHSGAISSAKSKKHPFEIIVSQ